MIQIAFIAGTICIIIIGIAAIREEFKRHTRLVEYLRKKNDF